MTACLASILPLLWFSGEKARMDFKGQRKMNIRNVSGLSQAQRIQQPHSLANQNVTHSRWSWGCKGNAGDISAPQMMVPIFPG